MGLEQFWQQEIQGLSMICARAFPVVTGLRYLFECWSGLCTQEQGGVHKGHGIMLLEVIGYLWEKNRNL